MRKIVFLGLVLLVFLGFQDSFFVGKVRADDDCLTDSSSWPLDKLERCAAQLEHLRSLSEAATAPLESEIDNLSKRVKSIQTQIRNAERKQIELEDSISEREDKLTEQYVLLSRKLREYYKRIRNNSGLVWIMSQASGSERMRELEYRAQAANQDRTLILSLSDEITKLEKDKETAESNKKRLAVLQTDLDKQIKFLSSEVEGAKAYQNVLSGKISSLQQTILAAKSGSFITSVGDVELSDDYNASIKGFRESAPGGSFAVFSFGAYTHRKGMSQYGARGRAGSGQSYQSILKAYYGKEPVGKDTSGTISVSGVGSVDFENYYLMGIAEMPSSWHPEALKAQAVAARTYAYRYKTSGQTICTTETCQVFKSSKANNPPAEWRAAVEATRGQVLEDVTTFYSSTSGGYSTTSGWDTTDGGGGGNFLDKSWEKAGGSPWAYKSWYRQGYTSSGNVCSGHGDPWLNNEEFTDVVNAAIVLKNGSDERVVPMTTSCGGGGNPYSFAELRSKGGVSSVTSVVVGQGDGLTNDVLINGSIHLTGLEFKKGYNLRAPGYLRIPQGVGFGSSTDFAFFNIEKK